MTIPLAAIDVLATDYDRTLTDETLVIRSDTRRALTEAKEAGLRVLVVSGRDVPFLREHVGDLADLIVAENGAFLLHGDGPAEPLFASWPGRDALLRLGFELECGEASANGPVEWMPDLERAVVEAKLEIRLEKNRDRVMLLPVGVEKGTALAAALARLEASPATCAAVGDGENDLSLLAAAGHRLAVDNAVPELKAIAHEVLPGFGGEAVSAWLRQRWLPARAASPPPGAVLRG